METMERKDRVRFGNAFGLAAMLIVLLSSLAYAQNQVIITLGAQDGGCSSNGQCASNLCVGGLCVSCSLDGDCGSNLCVSGVCTSCSGDSDCSETTNNCVNSICSPCSTDLSCSTSTGLCVAGKCASCSNDGDCATNGFPCLGGKCKSCEGDVSCSFGICLSDGLCKSCSDAGVGCPNNWNCNAGTGKCSCRSQGQTCNVGGECCSGACRSGVCAMCVADSECPPSNECSDLGLCVKKGQGPQVITGGNVQGPSGGPSGSSSSSSYSSNVQITREVEKEAAAPFIFALFGVSKKKVEASATCIRGALCYTNIDCCGAECLNGACLCAKGACVTSGECCTGYCEKGICKDPPQMSLFIADALHREVTSQFGCTGLIEQCDPSETQCVSICNGLTGVLALVSFGFGGFVWRSYKHPVPGLLAAFMPVFISMLTYPFVGIVIGIVMLGLLLVK